DVFQGRLSIIDVNPASPTFHQVLQQLAAPGDGNVQSVRVNSTTHKVYIAVNTGAASGVYAFDPVAQTSILVSGTGGVFTLVVNESATLVYAVSGSNLFAIDGATDTRLATIALPAGATTGAIDQRLAVHKGTGHVYVRVSEFPNSSRLVIVDGNRSSATFNTILTMLALGREDGTTMVAVDETANRVIATSKSDLKSTIIDAVTNAIVGTVAATQPRTRIAIDPIHHRAYVLGGIGFIQAIDLATGVQQGSVPVGVEQSFPAVNTIAHTAYVPQTGTSTAIALVDQTGQIGTVTGMPHGDGRMLTAVRNSLTNRIYVVNANATAAGGSEGPAGVGSVIPAAADALAGGVPLAPGPAGPLG